MISPSHTEIAWDCTTPDSRVDIKRSRLSGRERRIMSRQIHQDDFSCLQVADTDHNSSLNDMDVKDVDLRSCKAARPEKRLCGDDAPYVPVNFITAEVYSMIAAWESCETKRMESEARAVESDRKVYYDALYQPLRCAPTVAPPKRFYRRSWITMTRRTLDHARKSIMAHRRNSEGQECSPKSID